MRRVSQSKALYSEAVNPYLQSVIRYAESFWGVPYLYGGNSRLNGIDCSGLVCEVLRSVGLVGAFEDLSAQGLYDKFAKYEVQSITTGGLCFYGSARKSMSHVAFITSPYTVIEAGGGDSSTTSEEASKKRGACVRNRSISHRTDLRAIVYPPYPWE